MQFEIIPRLKELEDLKHEIEKDLFLRLGIAYGTDKTHITNINLGGQRTGFRPYKFVWVKT